MSVGCFFFFFFVLSGPFHTLAQTHAYTPTHLVPVGWGEQKQCGEAHVITQGTTSHVPRVAVIRAEKVNQSLSRCNIMENLPAEAASAPLLFSRRCDTSSGWWRPRLAVELLAKEDGERKKKRERKSSADLISGSIPDISPFWKRLINSQFIMSHMKKRKLNKTEGGGSWIEMTRDDWWYNSLCAGN